MRGGGWAQALSGEVRPREIINLGTAGALKAGLRGTHQIGLVLQHVDTESVWALVGWTYGEPLRLSGSGLTLATGDILGSDPQLSAALARRGLARHIWVIDFLATFARVRNMPSREPWMTSKDLGQDVVKSYTGHLLVAMPTLRDPHFERTVVFMLAHEDDGALGVVLNRPTGVSVAEVLPGWEPLVSGPQVLFEGGPVGGESAICVARARSGVAGFVGFSRIVGQIGTIDLSLEPARVGEKLEYVRVYHGYAGWESGQLEKEIEEGSWFVFGALPSDPFLSQPEDLWQLVLRRQGGLTAAVAHFPPDPHLN